MHRILRQGKKVGTAIGGGVIILAGIIMIPYPGPGWLVVFAGFAVLSTEFAFAAKTLAWLKGKYKLWEAFVRKQPKSFQLLMLGFTGLVVLVTIWLLNTFGIIDDVLRLDLEWLHSPLFR